ncbi:MAG: excisionase family DNA-binding protein [Deltaproteobacteria bacterium]|nr:excisionase family DNA-binding protein [Deltaproteobacteria bacterium]MCL5277286.1 excisionase family DNA-binding protein [Deltaproteobacteria bacterium]
MAKNTIISMINTNQAAATLGVSVKTIYRMEEKGIIQSIRTPGGQRRFNKKDLEHYIRASKSITAPQNPSKYKTNLTTLPSYANERIEEDALFTVPEVSPYAGVARIQEQITLKNIKSHKQHYDSDLGIFKWIDEWDFRSYHTKTYTHGFHNYPAMFIPQVARKLIQAFSSEGETVCDIFCGSGTTLVESSLLNRNSIGIELNPLAVLIAKVKTTPINPQTLTDKLKVILDDYKSAKSVSPPKFTNLDFWFSESAIRDLSKLKQAIWNISEENIRNFFSVCFSEVVRIISFTKHKEFKLVRDKDKLEKSFKQNVLKEFMKLCENNILGMKEYINDITPNAHARIILGDSTKDNGIPENSIDFIITSPPYGDSRTTVAYGQFSRLPSQWLELLPAHIKDVDKELLGGKNNISLDDQILDLSETLKLSINVLKEKDMERAKDVLSFYIDLNKAISQAYKLLKSKRYFCVIIGNRTVKELVLKTDEIISELAEKIGFIPQGILYRNIPNKRMPLKNSPTNEHGKTGLTMQKESIVLLKKL